MNDWPIGLSTGCFYHMSIFEVLDIIRQNGIAILEVCSSRDHLDYHDLDTVKRAAAEISKRGIQTYSFHAPFGRDIDISALDDARRERSLAEVLTAVHAAGALHARYFVLHPGPEESDRPPAEAYLRRLSNASGCLGRVAEACNRYGMRLALENMLPHLLFGPMPDLFWLLGSLKTRNIGVCLDTGHAFLAQSLYGQIDNLGAHLLMMHAADNHGKEDDHLPPGKGDIEWPRIVAALSRIKFKGPVILELSGREGDDPAARLQEVIEARQYLRNLADH